MGLRPDGQPLSNVLSEILRYPLLEKFPCQGSFPLLFRVLETKASTQLLSKFICYCFILVYCMAFICSGQQAHPINVLKQAVHHEAFTYMDGQKEFVQIDHNDLYPYLLVNIGSGVSMLKVILLIFDLELLFHLVSLFKFELILSLVLKQVDGDGKFERVSGTNVGGGTFWGLGRLLTKCKRLFSSFCLFQ